MSNSRPLPSSFDGDEDFYSENRFTKLRRRLFEEPLIPLGIAITCLALYRASKSLKLGDKAATNKYFRWRIYGQAFTIVAMVGGSYYYQSDREKRKKMDEGEKMRLAEEKRRNWIRELEVRDQEDKEFRERARELCNVMYM
ncbi:hypoxia induced protein conserved region-domain-containing protein [Peziza echinospora]|nr:hypoxia induced protein conserved region-domain-containing protein [Peziza echinospora]